MFSFQHNPVKLLDFQNYLKLVASRQSKVSMNVQTINKFMQEVQQSKREKLSLQRERAELQKKKQQIQRWKKGAEQQDKRLHEVQLEYTKKIQYLKEFNQKQQEIRSSKDKKNEDKIKQLKLQVQNFKSRAQSVQTQLQKANYQIISLKSQLQLANKKYIDIQKQLLIYKDNLHCGRRSIPLANSFQDIMCSKLGRHILQFLQGSDMVNLMIVNRKLNAFVSSDPILFKVLIKISKKSFEKKEQKIRVQNSYYKLIANKVPEEVIRVNFFKFFCLKRQAGIFMAPVINKAAQLFNRQYIEMCDQMSFSEELKLVLNLQNRSDQNVKALAQGLQKSCLKIQNEVKQIGQNFQVDRSVVQAYIQECQSTAISINEEIQLMSGKIRDTARLFAQDEKELQKYFKLLQENYVRLFVYGKLMINESRNLQQLLMSAFSLVVNRFKHQMSTLSELEDLQAQLQSERQLKNYLSKKCKDQDSKIFLLQNDKLAAMLASKENAEQSSLWKQKYRHMNQQFNSREKLSLELKNQNKLLREHCKKVEDDLANSQRQLQTIRNIIVDMNN